MHGDKAEDFALLLSYLYNPYSLVFKRHDPNTPRVVSGVIRLADKYLIEPLHRRLVQQVCDGWPTTLDDFDVSRAEIDTLERLPGRSVQFTIRHCDGDPYPGISGPVAAIQFAQEFGCPQILRAAFYRLALAPIARDWYFFQWPPEALARLATLDKEDLLRYIHGCEMLGSYRPSATQFMCDDCGEPWNVEQGPPVDRACYQYIARLVEVTRDTYHVHGDPLC